MNKQFQMPEQLDTITQQSISMRSLDSLHHDFNGNNNQQTGVLFTNRPQIASNLNAMQSQREQSTPSPEIHDINDSTFIGDVNEIDDNN